MLFRKILNNHLLMSGFFKGISGLSLFVSIPILINFLGTENYAVWILVFSLFQLVLLMDFGIQSSLKTKIPLLQHENKTDLLKIYIRSTYKISICIAFLVVLCSIIFIAYIDIKSILNINFLSASFVNKLFIINIFLFALNFVANIHKSLYVAFLKGKYAEESLAVNQFGILILTILCCLFFKSMSIENKLITISLINGIFCLLVNIFYTLRFFRMEKLSLQTNIREPAHFLKDILQLGFKFMIIQIATLFIFSFDNYIISNAFTPKDVVPYEVVNKLFQLPNLIIFAMLSPLWSMFATDYLNKNRTRLLLSFKRFNIVFIGISVSIIVLSLLTPYIISVWIKTPVDIPQYLIPMVGVVTCFKIFTAFYIFFLLGIGNVNKYILLLLVCVLLKLPVTYWFISLGFGINSVVLSTLILMIFWMIVIPFQSYSLVFKIKNNE